MPNTPPLLVAGGDIYPSRFVTMSTSEDNTGIQSTANSEIIGISQVGTNYPPLSNIITPPTVAAEDGQPFRLFGDGEQCLVEAGGVITNGELLKADGDGKAVEIATTGTTIQNYGAVALQSASADGVMILVQVHALKKTRPALT
jgi:hypothetical protein